MLKHLYKFIQKWVFGVNLSCKTILICMEMNRQAEPHFRMNGFDIKAQYNLVAKILVWTKNIHWLLYILYRLHYKN